MSILGKRKLLQIYVCSTLFCNSFITSPQINQNIGFNRRRRSTKWYIDTTFSSFFLFMVWVSILWEETSPAKLKVPQELFLIYFLYPFQVLLLNGKGLWREKLVRLCHTKCPSNFYDIRPTATPNVTSYDYQADSTSNKPNNNYLAGRRESEVRRSEGRV